MHLLQRSLHRVLLLPTDRLHYYLDDVRDRRLRFVVCILCVCVRKLESFEMRVNFAFDVVKMILRFDVGLGFPTLKKYWMFEFIHGVF